MKLTHLDLDDGIILVELDGRLDARAVEPLKDYLRQFTENRSCKIIIHLQDVPFIDSSGLVALVSGLRMANENGGQLLLCNAQSQAQLVFRLTMLDRVISVHPTVADAQRRLTL